MYPTEKWNPDQFLAYQRKLVDSLMKNFAISNLDDWYRVRVSDLRNKPEGVELLNMHGGSLPRLLSSVFPQHKWHKWKWSQLSSQDFLNSLYNSANACISPVTSLHSVDT